MNFKTYSDLWIKAVNDKETEGLSKVLSDKLMDDKKLKDYEI